MNDHKETKGEGRNALTYLSWAWAWSEVKKVYPLSFYTIYEAENGCLYHTDGRTCWVKTGVTIVDGDFKLEHIEYLPVLNFQNRSISLNDVTSYDVNKAIQRSLTKACARHGLGLYIYAKEDLPEEEAANMVTCQDVDKVIRAYCRGMSPEKKKEVAETIKSITGNTANYMEVKDQDTLRALMEHFSKKKEE